MDITEDKRPKFSEIIKVWWRFFWRYAIIFVLFLLIGGLIINQLGKANANSSSLYAASLIYGLIANMLVSLLVFKMILGKQRGKSNLILVPASVKRKAPDARTFKINNFRLVLTWWGYFWRFALFAFAVGFTFGYLNQKYGISIFGNAKILGNIAVLPGSLIVFLILMWRKSKRRKLDIVKAV